ncbi:MULTISPECIES: 2-oxo acid dehydrogenase subunit E2 [Psychrobacter]|jgi:pyruvate dehydrogenase E2 component (dihydrolipoamide acetyltransferase)|uniref:Dihydrolipoamide acetyltransferase component of pyruvate dehydrogenase complex n=1 Tax=Psychrobacter pacificensis TaxID=112002 RepID=A0A1G6ZCX8_9GAMM|nr:MULTISPECIES: 2-oxo acid dehydrogenase subunit E2 [Psychrobacter]GLR27917.1 dihydrolipoamide acetyltransferase component of pyruvate dehydrogenase complex [Psychrobacter pacificensis]SDD99596.1 pyruvate dehydrogenase E2 component (dihydrolipoamide acetyltransferase) [Psychrobacter pacificensis]HBD04230.1 pyruvate dehydrogenase complex dihydrolipoyllysine-residue acetyltransferase [Psychrobacter sp.]|tara:strand:+ start:2377 stop:4074 length:1698 start_codon:yes stop_codon:yes gene_type:complete
MDIKAPDLGVDSAEVSEIMVAVGDVIAKDDNIVLLESDKASVEVPSSAAGKVTKINVAIGDQVSEGMVLIEVESADASDDNDDTAEEVTDSEQADDNNEDAPVEDDADAEEATDDAGEGASTTHALPDIGVDEAQVAEIMVSVGDTVSADESILLIESDKASVEVPAPEAGVVEKILVNAGDTVANGQDFIVIKAAGTPKAKPKADTAKTEDKADKPAPKTESKSQPAPTGEPEQAPAPTSTAAPAGKKLSEAEVNEKLVDVYAGPAVRKLARQLGVDITQVKGSALNDRILKEDLFAHVKNRLTTQQAAPAAQGAVSSGLPKLPDMSNVEIWGETETQDLSRLQKVSIPQLNYNTYLPQVTQFDLSDITETEKLRGELKGDMKAQGIGLTILAFIVKATAYALTQHPRFNSHLSDDNTQIILRKSVNMGIAVATDDGLVVPVIKNAQDKGIKQIAIEIGELAGKARDKKLTTKDMQGASFTISSQGILGGTSFTPLVNWPQVGILGASEATMQPVWNDAKQTFEPRLMLPLSLSYDHRVINGADAAVFTRYVATLLADPRRILL